jgi:hypothetical protein
LTTGVQTIDVTEFGKAPDLIRLTQHSKQENQILAVDLRRKPDSHVNEKVTIKDKSPDARATSDPRPSRLPPRAGNIELERNSRARDPGRRIAKYACLEPACQHLATKFNIRVDVR